MILMLTSEIIDKNSSLEFFAEGYSNKLYLFTEGNKKYIYRKSRTPIDKVYKYAWLFERYTYSKFQLINDTSLIYEYIPGKSLNDVIKIIKFDEEQKLFYNLGNIFSKINLINYTNYLYKGNIYQSWNEILLTKSSEIKTDKVKDLLFSFNKFTKKIPLKKQDKSLIHGDFSVRNIICTLDNKLAIIDWDKFIVGDHYFELSNVLSRLFNRSRSSSEYELMTNSFLKGYFRNQIKKKDQFINSIENKIYSLYFTIEFINHWDKLGVSDKVKLFENRVNFLVNWLDCLDC